MVSKYQIVNGVVNYAKTEILRNITDKPLKMILATCISALEANPSIADAFFKNEIVAQFLAENGGEFDIEIAFDAAEKTLAEYGDFPVTIPAIKFVSPTEKTLTFSVADIQNLKKYIVGGET